VTGSNGCLQPATGRHSIDADLPTGFSEAAREETKMAKSYEGERGPKGLLVYVLEDRDGRTGQLPPRLDLMAHTPDGAFECGFRGSGPSQLALAMLADYLGDDREALNLHLAFRDLLVAELPRDRDWHVTAGYIDARLIAVRASRPQEHGSAMLEHA
jgi:Family of unknown function (DUF6166)